MSDIFIQISAGDGPRECRWVVTRLTQSFIKEGKQAGITVTALDGSISDAPAASTILKLHGCNVENFLRDRLGTILWIGQSPYRPHHKRKNWFVGVTRLPQADTIPELKVSDIDFTATRASGPGGQHVNKTNSAVRAVHRPSQISVTAQEERSQYANKKLCWVKLVAIFSESQAAEVAGARRGEWQNHKALERGNPVRTYVGEKFRLR